MISVNRATEEDFQSIVSIGKIAVAEAHKGSTSEENLKSYLDRNYNENAIIRELQDCNNMYHIIRFSDTAVGFSKIILNAKHPAITAENVTMLDRIYLLKEYFGKGLGHELLHFNIQFACSKNQSGMWLYTWVGNNRAINFYCKEGFKIIGSHKFYVTETNYNSNHHMFLNLPEVQNS
jgi:GNAT superfamily N-acetyltransferase